MRGHRWTTVSYAAIAVLVIGACGGDDDSVDDDSSPASSEVDGSETGVDDAPSEDDADDGGDLASGGDVRLGEPTLTAEPSTAWAEVDGDRLDYAAAGSIHFECSITDQRVTVNFQTADGHNFLLQGAPQGDEWFLNTTFATSDSNEKFLVDSMSGSGEFVVGDGALSYEGRVDRIVDNDIMNAEEVDAEIAVNCASAGGDPTATVGEDTYVFPLSGAQSVTCDVSATAIDVMVNRLALDGLQLQVDATDQDGQWVGAVTVYTADGNLRSPIPPDGTGLVVDGTSVVYEGTFERPDGSQAAGTVEVTC